MKLVLRIANHQAGETLSVRRLTKDAAGNPVAPDSLTFEIEGPSLAKESFVLGASSEVATLATGDYQLNYALASGLSSQLLSGRIRMESGGIYVVEHFEVFVERANVTSPA